MSSHAPSSISVRLAPDLIAKLDAVATALERDRSWVINKALALYIEQEGAEVLNDARGLAEFDRGEDHDIDEVIKEAREIVAGDPKRRAG